MFLYQLNEVLVTRFHSQKAWGCR